MNPSVPVRPVVRGKFFFRGEDKFFVRGVTYGTFAPDAAGCQFPEPARVGEDFAAMRRAGINTVRTYTVPDAPVLDAAAAEGLHVIVGLPWSQHVAFLDDPGLEREIRTTAAKTVARLAAHPAVIMFALGNEIPAEVVRWHGQARVERFLRDLCDEARQAAPEGVFTYVNFPPTEFLDLPFLDVCAFNLYLHRERDLRAYVARLQHLAGHRPLLLAEAGADSIRNGPDGQAALTAMQLRAAFAEGACGAVAFAWTDEWWRGGSLVEDWSFGLVDRARRPKPALAAVTGVYGDVPFPAAVRERWPKVSVIVCAYNAAGTIDECVASLGRLTYPDYEVVVVNDGSTDETGALARRYPYARVIDTPNGGLSSARNVGLAAASGEIVAYTDADVRVDPDWLSFLVQPLLASDVVGSGGPNVVPSDDPWMAQCVARAPGGPTHVLLNDRVAEHVPGCNMAFRREALLAIGGFNPIYLRAGDDVDVCWRLQARGWTLGFAAAALVWHRHRASVKAYWRQQMGYGEGEVWLAPHHPDKFDGSHIRWQGHIYSSLPFVRTLSRTRVNAGVWGTSAFPSVYRTDAFPFAFMPHSVAWQSGCLALIVAGLAGAAILPSAAAAALVAAGLAGFTVTAVRCVRYALTSDIRTLPPRPGWSAERSRRLYRATIAWLHFIQPFARVAGRLRGRLAAPGAAVRSSAAVEDPISSWQEIRYSVSHALARREFRFWSEAWEGRERLLSRITDRLRATRLTRVIEIDDGWDASRDVSVALGAWGWVDLRLLREEHGGGRGLVRIARGLRITPALLLMTLTGVLVTALASLSTASAWPLLLAGIGVLLASARAVARAALTITAVDRVVARTMADQGFAPHGPGTESLVAALGLAGVRPGHEAPHGPPEASPSLNPFALTIDASARDSKRRA